jgi:hypothetical protein
MKKVILLVIAQALFLTSYAQTCTRSAGSFVKAQGGYNIAGIATLTNTDGVLTLGFNNSFSTVSGPDLHVYLGKQNASPTAQGNETVVVSLLKSNTGAQSFTVPQGVDILQYDYVLIHCLAGNHFWGGGQLGNVTGTCPVVAGIDDLETNFATVYFDQASKILHTTNTNEKSDAVIYDLQGQVVYQGQLTAALQLANLKSGVYMLKSGKIALRFVVL